jgi:hypothetical protein
MTPCSPVLHQYFEGRYRFRFHGSRVNQERNKQAESRAFFNLQNMDSMILRNVDEFLPYTILYIPENNILPIHHWENKKSNFHYQVKNIHH